MKAIALLFVLLTLAIGTYISDRTPKTEVMVEDTVENSMAAPAHPEIPL